MAKSWDINPATGDYIMDDQGRPQQTDSLRVPAYFRIKSPRGQWLFAPNPKWGCVIPLRNRKNSIQDQQQLVQEAVSALQPIQDDGRAALINVALNTTAQRGRNAAGLEIELLDNQGQIEKFILPGVL